MNILIDGQTLETEEINRGIGVYFKNVLYHLIRNNAGNIFYIMVSRIDSLEMLDPWIARQVLSITDDLFEPSFVYERESQYTDRVNEVILEYHIDCMWVPNPLMVNVLFPNKRINCELFVTVHDLIPFIMPIKEWNKKVTDEYIRRLDYLKDTHMLCVSNATKRDICERMGDGVSTYVTLEAANNELFYRKRVNLNHSEKIIIVFTGGFDYRKNIYGAVEAFALAKKNMPDKQLLFYIVCKYTLNEKKEFYERLKELQIYEDVKLTGFITDSCLADLYYNADVFFFPSFYEGFGLPLLEAMLGGAYILSADNSSLPEVCGDYAIYCNAYDINDMADKLCKAICNSINESISDKQRRQEYALGFSWKKTAQETFRAFTKHVYNSSKEKKNVALVTPWLNQQTGIANFVYKLMPYLSKYFNIDLFIDDTLDKEAFFLPYIYGNKYFIHELDQRHEDYYEIIYHMGNNTLYHTGIYNYLRKYPGIVELHDFCIHPFFYHAYYLKGDKDTYRQALIDGYGKSGTIHFDDVDSGRACPDSERFTMSESVGNISKKVILHNIWSYKAMKSKTTKYVVPLPCFRKEEILSNNRRKAEEVICKKIEKDADEIIIGCFGWINDNKRPDVIVKAVMKLKDLNYKVKLAFFGKNNSQKITDIMQNEKILKNVKITGFISAEEYIVAMELCDIVVNLRYPSMGESSATLCETFEEGKAVIVSAMNQYLEFPDDVCWKIPVCSYESVILAEMLKYLIDHENVRNILGQNAKKYANEILNCKKIARMYANIIN